MSKTNSEMIAEMVTLQDAFNTKTNGPEWKTGVAANGKPIMWEVDADIELSELIESTPYKHWKDTHDESVDIDNIMIEFTDAWHFIMSLFISAVYANTEDKKSYDISIVINALNDNIFNGDNSYYDTLYSKEQIADIVKDTDITWVNIVNQTMDLKRSLLSECYARETQNFPHIAMIKLMLIIHIFNLKYNNKEFTLTDLYKLYIGKNALNEVRQMNGYKDGTYNKQWGNGEDNVVMQETINNTELTDITYDNMVTILNNIYLEEYAK